MKTYSLVVMIAVVLAAGTASASGGAIRGRIRDGAGKPIVGATVRLLELERLTHSDAKGEFLFPNIANGSYHVFVTNVGYASEGKKVNVSDTTSEVEVQLRESAIKGEEVVVSASPYASSENDQYQPVATKSMVELHQSPGSSLAEEIGDIPGVAVRYNGAAPTRPILRGLDNNEVLVLENGLRTGDLATFDPAHATPIEAEAVQEVDIIRGPASVMYGPNAIGGVVNVITNTIPMASSKTVSGTASLAGNSVNDLYSGHFNAVLSDGASAFQISAGGVHSDAIGIPNGAYTDGGTGQTYKLDTIPQSFMHTSEEGIGYSYTGDFGMIGFGAKHYMSDYGIPGDPVFPADPTLPPSSSRIVQEKYTFELSGLFNVGGSFIDQIRLNANASDYNHSEYPTAEDSLGNVSDDQQNHFHQNDYDINLQFIEQRSGDFQGTLGLWANFNNLTLDGAQPLGPNSLTTGLAGYAYEEYIASENTRVQAAVRFDYNKISTFNSPNSTVAAFQDFQQSRTANAVTGSIGIIQKLTDELTGSVSVGRSFRAPTMQELFARGPDDASLASFISDPNLVPETGLEFDASLKGRYSNFSFAISPFLNLIQNYIYSYDNGILDTIDQPEYDYRQFTQTNAELYGFEASVSVQLVQYVSLTASSDYVISEDVTNNVPLPMTPPLRGLLRLNYLDNMYAGMIEWRLAAAQNRLGDGDFATAGYGIVNLGFGVRLLSGSVVHSISLHADNLLNQVYYDHLSVIGNFVPQPARGFRLTYDATF